MQGDLKQQTPNGKYEEKEIVVWLRMIFSVGGGIISSVMMCS